MYWNVISDSLHIIPSGVNLDLPSLKLFGGGFFMDAFLMAKAKHSVTSEL